MAGIKKIIQYDVIVNGTPTVVKSLKDVEDHIAGLADRLKEINRKIQNGDLTAQMAASLEDEAKRINEETKQLRKVATDIMAYQGDMESISRSISNGTKSLSEINKMYRKVQEKLRIVQTGDEENTQKIRDLLREILAVKKDLEKPMKGGFTDKEMEAQAKATLEAVKTMNALKGNSLGAEMPKVSRNELEQAINYYEGIVKSYREMDPAAESARKKVKLLQDELNKYVREFVENPKLQAEQNTKDNRRGIMLAAAGKGLGAEGNEFVDSSTGKQRKYTNQELQEAIKLTKELADTTAIGSNTQKGYVNQLKAVEDQQRKVNEAEKQRIADMQAKQDKKDAEATLRAAKKNDGKIFSDQSKDIDTEALQKALKYYEDLRKGMRDMSEEAIKTDANIAVLNKELNKYADAAKRRDDAAIEAKRSAIMDAAGSGRNTYADADGKAVGYSKKDLDEAIKLTKELAETTDLGSEKQVEYANQLKAVESQIRLVAEAEKKAAEEAKKANDLEGARNKAGATMRNINSSTVEDIKEAIEVTKKLRDEQIVNSEAWREYQHQIEAAEVELNKYSKEVENARKEEEKAQKQRDAEKELEKSREKASVVMGDLENSSVESIKEAIEVTKKLRDEQKVGSSEWENYQKKVEAAEKVLGSYSDKQKRIQEEEAKLMAEMTMSDVNSATTNDLKDAIEVTKKLRDEQIHGSDAWKEYQAQIEKAEEKLNSYNKAVADSKLDDSRSSAMSRDINSATAEQLREDIKVLTQWRDSVEASGGPWDEINNKINEAKKTLVEYEDKVKSSALAVDGYKGLDETFKDLSRANEGVVVSSKNLKRAEDELKKELKDGNLTEKDRISMSEKLSAVQSELARREKLVTDANKRSEEQARRTAAGFDGYKKVVGDLAGSSLEHLKMAQEELRERLEKTNPNDEVYKEYAESLKKVNDRIREVNGSLGEVGGTVQKTDNWFLKSAERFTKYAATWLNFYKILDSVKSAVHGMYQLSDSIADIQKVTKMSGDEIDHLSLSIDKIDTRASQEQLHILGYQAGMLGLKSKKDILGFVEGANQMNWALKELGEDGAVNMMKVATATGDVAAYGVEGALSKLGSAINEITASSPAAAGAVTDVVSRLSALGSVANYSSSELVAIGSTLSSLNIPAERGATAVTRIMMSMSTKMSAIAQHAGLTSDELKELKKTTDEAFNSGESKMTGSMAVMIRVLEALKEKTEKAADPIRELEPIFGDMGRQSTRLAETLTQLVNNVDMVKEHVGITSQAFEEGVSMLNEYNIKNETANALMQRIGNNIREKMVNSELTRYVEKLLRSVLRATEGVGFLYRAFRLLIAGTVSYGIYALYVNIGKLSAALVSAFNAGSALALKYSVWVAGLVSDTLATQLNTKAKEDNATVSTWGALASDQQSISNGKQTVTWGTLTAAIKAANLSVGQWIALATVALGPVILLGGALANLVFGIGELSEAERIHEEGMKKMAEAEGEAAGNILLEKDSAKRLFDELIEVSEQIDKYTESTNKASDATDKNAKAKEEIVVTDTYLIDKISEEVGKIEQESEVIDNSTDSVKKNAESKDENAQKTDELSASEEDLKNKTNVEKAATDSASVSTRTNSDAKAVAKKKTDDLTGAEGELKKMQDKRSDIIRKLESQFPQWLQNANLEEIKTADLIKVYEQLNLELDKKRRLMMANARLEAAKNNFTEANQSQQKLANKNIDMLSKNLGLSGTESNLFKRDITLAISDIAVNDYDSESAMKAALSKVIQEAAKPYRKYNNGYAQQAFNNVLDIVTADLYNNYVSPVNKAKTDLELQQQLYEDEEAKVLESLKKGKGYTPTQRNYVLAKYNGSNNGYGREIFTDYNLEGGGVVDLNSESVADLTKWHKELDDTMNMPYGNAERAVKYFELTGEVEPKNEAQSRNKLRQMSTAIKDRLKSMNISDSGKALHTPKTREKHEPKGRKKITVDGKSMFVDDIKSDQTAALSALRGYYETRKQKVKEDYIANRITTQAKDSMLSQLEMDYKFDLAELYKKLLGEESKFQQTKYGKWFEGKNLEQLSKFLLKMGKSEKEGGTGDSALIDGMRANGEKAYNDALDVIIKHMDSLHKIFLQYDYTGSINEAYQKKLEEVDLFWGAYQERVSENAQETAELQIRKFKELAEQSLGWNASDLRKKMESMTEFDDWFKGKDDTMKFFVGYDDKGNKIMRTQLENDLEGLLIILQNYRHELIDAQKKIGDEGHKRALEMAEDAINVQTHIEKTQEANEALLKSLQSEGYVNSATVDRYEIEHLQQRIDFQNALVKRIQLEGGDVKKEFEVLTSLQEKMIEKNAEINRSIREQMKQYVDVFNEMTNSLTTAGNEHASLTALAEIAAKRRLGIAVDETKKEYMIYSRSGKAQRKMMTEEEKLKWDMENDIRNQHADATIKWLHDWGEKLSQDFANAVNSQMAIEQQRAHEQAMLEEADKAANGRVEIKAGESESVKMLEAQITGHFTRQVNDRLAEVSREMAARFNITKEGLDKIAGLYDANNGVESVQSHFGDDTWKRVDVQNVGDELPISNDWKDTAMKRLSERFEKELAGVKLFGSESELANVELLKGWYDTNNAIADYHNRIKRFEAYKVEDVSSMDFDEVSGYLSWLTKNNKTGSKKYTAAFGKYSQMLNEDESLVDNASTDLAFGEALILEKLKAHKQANAEMLQNDIETHQQMVDSQNAANTQMTERHKNMIQAMISAANLYGVVYNAVMNDSLSASQRAGMATLQAFGQVAMSMLSVLMADTLASVTGKTVEGTARIWGKFATNPWVAIPMVAALTATMGGLTALATRKITKNKQEISAITGAASGKKVAAGMLTYAEGNYPVLGSDGEVYDAKRETNWKTKVYSSPHYGILGEKGPELIVDGITTRKMMTLRPDLYQDILDLARGRQAVRAKAYADGNYPAMPAVNGGGGAGADTNAMLVAAISQLNAQLAGGIKVAALGEDGAVRRLNEAEDWMRKHGLA